MAVASSARRFLAGFKALFICSAAEMLERLAGPGSDLDMFVRVLSLAAARTAAMEDDMDVDRAAATEDYMDVDGRSEPGARHRKEESG
ncbi:unnamed protein product [Miscanthus lutarioriparius]|uniref:Uncharacterized protein n=1 Tax=Miscanthus lutarioriparius TaxID=422564 RepID=A0A811RQB1_9POAL|nr:unnamed protein product [Miscanthus lutarioriparius]